MKKTLKFDYIPVLRESYEGHPQIQDGSLTDQLNLYWNNHHISKDIQSSKETAEKGFVQRSVEIELLNSNILKLDNFQTDTKESISLNATVELNNKKDNIWSLLFNYDLSNFKNNEYEKFNLKYNIQKEYFSFKLNGEALIVNASIESGKNNSCAKDFIWDSVKPICFELEEYGHCTDVDSRFIQVVRFTLL
jgi:hypothetical protein